MVSQIPTSMTVAPYVSFDWFVTNAFQSGLLLGVGFLIGILVGGLGVRLLYRQSVENCLRAFTLDDMLASTVGTGVWNPFHIQPTPLSNPHTANAECVLRVLIANEGRMKQTDFADITGWSDATISRLLSRMERDGDISRVNVGQTKLVFLGELRRDDESRRDDEPAMASVSEAE